MPLATNVLFIYYLYYLYCSLSLTPPGTTALRDPIHNPRNPPIDTLYTIRELVLLLKYAHLAYSYQYLASTALATASRASTA